MPTTSFHCFRKTYRPIRDDIVHSILDYPHRKRANAPVCYKHTKSIHLHRQQVRFEKWTQFKKSYEALPCRFNIDDWKWTKGDSKAHDLAWKHLDYYFRVGKKYPGLQQAEYSINRGTRFLFCRLGVD